MNKDADNTWQWVTSTPLGPLWADASSCGIRRLAFTDSYDVHPFTSRQIAGFYRGAKDPFGLKTSLDLWLQGYFAQDFIFETPPLDVEGTLFQQAVWSALAQIPAGDTTSYGQLAHRLGSRANRAVGSAVGANPLPLIIPCHRVLPRDGAIGNYAFGAARKAWLLEHEGINPI